MRFLMQLGAFLAVMFIGEQLLFSLAEAYDLWDGSWSGRLILLAAIAMPFALIQAVSSLPVILGRVRSCE